MDVITSTSNPKFKQLVKLLTNQKMRRSVQKTVLEGESLVGDYLATGLEVDQLIIGEANFDQPTIKRLIDQVDSAKVILVKSFLLDKITQLETAPGVMAIVPIPDQAEPSEIVDAGQLILIDRVQDPTNLGAILRSALAFGVTGVYLSTGSAEAFSPKAIRASMGASFKLPIYSRVDLAKLIPRLQSSQVQIYATSSHADQFLAEAKLPNRLAWLVGNEGQGVDTKLMSLANQTIKIPQSSQLESLNLAVATSLCLYEHHRQITK